MTGQRTPRDEGGAANAAVASVLRAIDSFGARGRLVRAPRRHEPTSRVSGTWVSGTQMSGTQMSGTQVPGTQMSGAETRTGRFRNAETASRVAPRTLASLLWSSLAHRDLARPTGRVPVELPDLPPTAAAIAATWLGHATVLVEVDGHRILTDPVFGDRVSPADFLGPRRLHRAPISGASLPPLDAVVISHDHYDHLERSATLELAASSAAPFLVPLGIGSHLRAWGVPAERIVELGWGQRHSIGTLDIVCTPARHFSGRGLVRNTTLWSSWTLVGPDHRVFFGGDTGYTPAFGEIGREHGPFDLTILPIGAYHDAWPDVHMTPEQALQAHHDLGGGVLLPIHWATFNLAPHPWAEPIERLQRAGETAHVATPPPGRRILPGDLARGEPWWRPGEANSSRRPGR